MEHAENADYDSTESARKLRHSEIRLGLLYLDSLGHKLVELNGCAYRDVPLSPKVVPLFQLRSTGPVTAEFGKFSYIKPVQTNFPGDSDSHFVYRKVFEIFLRQRYLVRVFASNHALKALVPAAVEVLGAEMVEGSENGLRDLCLYEERRMQGEDSGVVELKLVCNTIYSWKETISPHLAAEREGAVSDLQLLDSLHRCLEFCSRDEGCDRKEGIWSVIETATSLCYSNLYSLHFWGKGSTLVLIVLFPLLIRILARSELFLSTWSHKVPTAAAYIGILMSKNDLGQVMQK
ncbi:hypothetical protein NE237_024033 [Protea cynaroides]|uniref:Uncharacterized protein n=1 Tax=Protea cynaroides TaxID=273540 RepID=A0A9Q0HDX7_9MAGN|nr:hypothetical protein NE237_024033 [Protea cynaroides]